MMWGLCGFEWIFFKPKLHPGNVRSLVHPIGLEPITPRSEVWCSIQLSYGCILSAVKNTCFLTTTQVFEARLFSASIEVESTFMNNKLKTTKHTSM